MTNSSHRVSGTVAALTLVSVIVFTSVTLLRRSSENPVTNLLTSVPPGYRPFEARIAGFPWAPLRNNREHTSRTVINPAYLQMLRATGDALESAHASAETDAAALRAAGIGQLLLDDSGALQSL